MISSAIKYTVVVTVIKKNLLTMDDVILLAMKQDTRREISILYHSTKKSHIIFKSRKVRGRGSAVLSRGRGTRINKEDRSLQY